MQGVGSREYVVRSRDWDVGSRIKQGLVSRVLVSRVRVWYLRSRFQDPGLETRAPVSGFGFRVYGLGFRVELPRRSVHRPRNNAMPWSQS